MKTTKDFNINWTDSRGRSGVAQWKNMELTEENITSRLEDELNSNENHTEVTMSLTFDKSEFTTEFIEGLMSSNSDVISDTNEEIEISWSLYN